LTDKALPTSKRALNELRTKIFDGELAAGSDHLESELAALLNMSRTPVREAVLMLEGQGLLELRPRKGVRILPISPDDMSEIYDVLTELESLAAEQAAKARYPDKELEPLLACITDMENAIGASDLEAWSDGDGRFHQELVRLGGNSRVINIVSMMRDQVRRARRTTLFMRPLPTKSNQDHRLVYNAIKNGEADNARKYHRAHRREAQKIIVGLLHKHRMRVV